MSFVVMAQQMKLSTAMTGMTAQTGRSGSAALPLTK
jgi:hypothetical protein